MAACLSFEEIISAGSPQISRLRDVGNSYPTSDAPGACAAFSEEVRQVEALVRHTYALAAHLARKTGSLEEVATFWKEMSKLCDVALGVLRGLRDRYPYCGTPELYDLTLDYKHAADERFNRVKEELAWATTEIPKGLFPVLN